jgi:hypothetical protein
MARTKTGSKLPAKKKEPAKKVAPTRSNIVVSFSLTLDGFNTVESVVDEVRRKMRGHPVKFNKRYVYEALLTEGVKAFDTDQFIIDYISQNGGE